ncbi:MAG TPA: apolipoprotein N-acyltransferase [Thermoanaerobaculia bacterium]|nr:apolipoprotein N-acyltransferase [Thermoanaerobaculia bacterium]
MAAAGGWLWALQFEAEPLRVAPWLALTPLMLLLGSARPARWGWLHGFVYWLTAIPWIGPTLVTFGGLSWWLAMPLLALLAAFLGLYGAVFGWLGGKIWRRRTWVALWGLPALWVALEWVRGWFLGGFPWNLAAYAWVDVPGALPLAAWIGPWGVGYLVLWANAGIALGVARRRWPVALVGVLAPLLLLAVAGRFATADPGWSPHAGQPVRVLQPNIPNLTAVDWPVVLANYQKVLEMSRQACDAPEALVIWPESAAWPFSYQGEPELRQDLSALVAAGCPLLLNTAWDEDDGTRNAALLLSPGGGFERYDKRKLVPFGEYVPGRRLLPFAGTLARNAGDFTAADELTLLPWGRERLGVAICFEITFPGEVAEAVRAGATTLVTITNDAWYGDTSAPWQHFRAARFRAAETRRPLARAAITGISALVAADGGVEAQLGPFDEGLLRGRVRGATGLTPFARAPWLAPALSLLLTAAALWAARRRLSAWQPMG